MLFHIYNARMVKVDCVDAIDAKDALKHANKRWPGASVERWLTDAERRQKQYQDEVDLWDAMRHR